MTRVTSTTVELGGTAASSVLDQQGTVAMHTTCYEHVTKVLGLKATNSFWNPRYYDPDTLTITKQIIFINEFQILEEIRSLIWLALSTGSTLIIPNILGSESQHKNSVDLLHGQALWPAFKVAYLKRSKGQTVLKVKIAEPAFYWRIERDYEKPPEPMVLFFDPKKDDLEIIKSSIDKLRNKGQGSRIILHSSYAYPINTERKKIISLQAPTENEKQNGKKDPWLLRPKKDADTVLRLTDWAKDSVGYYKSTYSAELRMYGQLPSLKNVLSLAQAQDVLQNIRNCANIFGPPRSNRTCFQICD